MKEIFKKRGIQVALGGVGLLVVVLFVLWQRCGFSGCPDVDRLKGYMPDEASTILDQKGQEVGKLFLTRRVIVPLDTLPKHVADAFVAMEDRRFWKHNGVDWTRVFGAAWKNVKELGIEEGSSTITMQLARNAFPENLPWNKKTIWRKIGEARVATKIEDKFTKQEILELYLNQIYFGHGAYGIEAAAQEYFGKSAAKLTLAEAATLAAIPRAPSRLNPRSNREQSLAGRKVVLERMSQQELITEAQATEAGKQKIRLRQGQLKSNDRAPYFVEAVRRILEEQVGDAIYSEGYTIHTTLDLPLQIAVEDELRKQLTAIESGAYGRYRHTTYAVSKRDTTSDEEGTPYLQAAAIFMDSRTGDVRALVGGRDYEDSQYNRATQSMRQPGSAFKPFVYAAAVSAGYPASHRLMDRPFRLVLDRRNTWEPQNYDGSYAGVMTMRDALTYSKNIPTIRLAMEVGVDRVVDMARQLGLEGRIPNVPSVVLGAAEVSPISLTSAFSTFSTLGSHSQARFITRVEDRSGNVVWSQEPTSSRVLDPAVAYIVTTMLKDVVDRGTATAVRGAGFSGPAAGKTGTTNDAADVWFVGYTPRIVGTIWMGFDRRKTVLRGATGGELAAPVWGRVMRRAGEETGDWLMPQGVEMRLVDSFGNVYGDECPTMTGTRHEYFMTGTAPVTSCYANPMYTYADSLGGYPSDSLAYDDGWWQRIKNRIFGADSVAVSPPTAEVTDSVRRDPVPPVSGPPVLGTPVPRPDSARLAEQRRRLRIDTVRPDTTRPKPDTIRRDTLRKPPPDTTRNPG
jgi:penicillin-binding protein 1A